MDGLGPVGPTPEEPNFHSEWEKHVFGLLMPYGFAAGMNSDQFRRGAENTHPVVYLTSRYYQHWMRTFELGLIHKGVIDANELEERTRMYLENPDAPLPQREDPEQIEVFLQGYRDGESRSRPVEQSPKYGVGDR